MVGAERRYKEKSGEQEWINKEIIKERREKQREEKRKEMKWHEGINEEGWLRG